MRRLRLKRPPPRRPPRSDRPSGPPVTKYLLLAAAIIAEVAATTALARSAGFTRFGPSVVAVVGYGAAFYLLSLVLQVMPTGVVYGLWAGLGIVLITLVAWIWGRQPLDWQAVFGLALISAGVVTINLFSKVAGH
jgi:small multidrug resistance pump